MAKDRKIIRVAVIGADTWFFRKDKANFGVMGDLGAHKIDLIRYLTDSEIKSVFAGMRTLDKKYADGSPIELEDNSTIFYGTKGVMKIFGDFDRGPGAYSHGC